MGAARSAEIRVCGSQAFGVVMGRPSLVFGDGRRKGV